MTKKFIQTFLFALVIFLSNPTLIRAQGFNGIIPLESTCDDVKRILKVDKCTFPQSVYLLDRFSVAVSYIKQEPYPDQTECYCVPTGIVFSIAVSYNKPVRIEDFEYKLKFSKSLADDIDTQAYQNIEEGVTVHSLGTFANEAFFEPTPDNKKKYRVSDCKRVRGQACDIAGLFLCNRAQDVKL